MDEMPGRLPWLATILATQLPNIVTINCSSILRLSLSEIKSEHIGGVIRQELALAECARRFEQLVVPARPCSEIDVSERRCNTACMKGVRDAGAARRTR